MAGETPITIVGNLAWDPRPFVTQSGVPITNFRVLSTPSRFDRQTNTFVDQEAPNSFDVKGFRDLAVHANASLKSGMRVVVTGNVTTETWADKDDPNKRHDRQVIVAEDIAVSLRFGTAAFQATPRQNAAAPAQVAQPQDQQVAAQVPQQPVAQPVAQVPQQPVAQPAAQPVAQPAAVAQPQVPQVQAPGAGELSF